MTRWVMRIFQQWNSRLNANGVNMFTSVPSADMVSLFLMSNFKNTNICVTVKPKMMNCKLNLISLCVFFWSIGPYCSFLLTHFRPPWNSNVWLSPWCVTPQHWCRSETVVHISSWCRASLGRHIHLHSSPEMQTHNLLLSHSLSRSVTKQTVRAHH